MEVREATPPKIGGGPQGEVGGANSRQVAWYWSGTVSPVRVHSQVRSEPALRKCHARVGIQPGQIVPAQRSWSPVRCDSSVSPVPALRTCQAKVGGRVA